MARLVFAAHDPGGALMIGAAAPELMRRGHELEFIAAGPGGEVWRRAGHEVVALGGADEIAAAGLAIPDGVIAATGFGEFERGAWRWAREQGVRSLAAIDSWTHLLRRFETPAGYDFPDLVAVIDAETEAAFSTQAAAGPQTAVVGQPHLEAQTARLRSARQSYRGDAQRPNLVFFSEPIIEDFGPGQRGFDQFQVFELAVQGLLSSGAEGLTLAVKPHPRETLERWRSLVGQLAETSHISAYIAEQTAEDLLAAADGAVGMTTMVLLEAHLARLPVLSLQPGRTAIVNPVIEHAAPVVTDSAGVPAAISALLVRVGSAPTVDARFQNVIEHAISRFADTIETRLLC